MLSTLLVLGRGACGKGFFQWSKGLKKYNFHCSLGTGELLYILELSKVKGKDLTGFEVPTPYLQ